MKYVNCEKYAKEILDEIKQYKHNRKFVIVSVGNDPASQSYIKGKIKDCEYCGIECIHEKFDEHESPEIVEDAIWEYRYHSDVSSIIVQLPLPKGHIAENLSEIIPTWKDVDGFVRDSRFKPCTPEGILYLLRQELGNLSGKTVLIIGRGSLVGRPLFDMLLEVDCTVTMAHSKTKDLNELLQRPFDIIVSAVGKSKLINLQLCNAKIVIDVGVNRDENGKLCGDCYNFDENVKPDMLVTPVPKGIGLMTRAMLMWHVHQADKPVKM